ncbi:MAG TPA: response regulator, partial [Chryseosolibacter sp.]|nr:response regulator [Chryseosolibacter sp.]
MDKSIQSKINVLLVDDHTLLREGLASMLKDLVDICVVGSVSSGEQAIGEVDSLRPDVVLMDIMMSG